MATSVTFDLFARDRASGAFTKVGQAAEKSSRSIRGLGSAFGSVSAGTRGLHATFGLIGRGAALAAGAAGIGGLIASFKGVYSEAREAQKVGAQTNAVIRSTGGAAKISSKQVGDLATAISNKVGVDDEAIQSGANLLLTFCLEESAQALSRERGWVSHAELRAGDEILAYDPDDGSIRWEPVDSVHRFAVDSDEMVRWQSRQIDVLSTPTHRWWTVGQNDRSRHTPQFQTTEQISGKQVRVLIGGGDPQAFAGEPTWSDELVELAGWIITEGWVDWERPSTRERNGVHFCQSLTANPDNVKRIRLLLNRLRTQGHRISETSQVAAYNGSTVLSWHIARDLGATLRMMLPDKKLTQQFVMSLTREQAGLLVDVLVLADGHTDRHGHRQYVQKDRGQLDILAGLCAMLGIRTTDVRSRSTAGALYLNSTNHAYGNRLNARREHYKGVVWCPHLRTGVWMARVRGRTFWTGNTGIRNEAGKGNDIFNRATRTITDMAAAMNHGTVTSDGLKTASIQVGKALQDPIKGTTALRKVGVSLTDQQEKQIRTLVDHGHKLEAQKIILGELNKEFGGSAAAGTNAMQKLGVVFGNIKEQIGAGLLPVIDRFASWLAAVLPGAVAVAGRAFSAVGKSIGIVTAAFRDPDITSTGFAGVLEHIGVAARRAFDFVATTVVPGIRAMAAAFKEGDITSDGFVGVMERVGLALRTVTGFVSKHRDLLLAMGKGIAAVTAAFVAFRVVMAAVNFVMAANPIGVVIIALGALVGGVIYAYKHSERFRAIVQAVWQALQQVGAFLVRTFTPTFQALGQTISTRVWPALQNLWAVVQRNIPAFVVFAKFIGGVITVVAALAAKVLGFLLPILAKLAGFLLGRLFGLIAQTVQYFGNMIRAVQSAWGTFRAFLAIVSAVWSTFVSRTSAAIGRVVGFITGLRDKIVGFYSGAYKWLYNAGRDVLLGFWDGLKAIWNRITGWISGLTGWIRDHKGPIGFDRRLLFDAGKAIMGGFERGLKSGGLKALGFVQSVAGRITGIVGQNTSSGAMQSMVAGYASMLYGWRGAEWDALNKLLTRESGFNPNAQNPTSTAYGLFQFLDSTWAGVGARKTSNPQGQTLAGLRYIAQRYGDPIAAWNHEMMAGWYGKGTPPGGLTFNKPTLIGVGESGSETVTVTPRGRGSVPATVINVNVTTVGQLDPQATNKIRQAIREALRAEGRPAVV